MRYIEVSWIHEFRDEPIRLVSELDPESFESRKLEFFRDGSVGFASHDVHSGGTELGTCEIPPLSKINSSGEFSSKEISKAEFEMLWYKYAKSDS